MEAKSQSIPPKEHSSVLEVVGGSEPSTPLVIKRRPARLLPEISSQDVDRGPITDESSFSLMQELARECVTSLSTSLEGINLDNAAHPSLQQIADFVNRQFSFTLQDIGGIATLSKQLEDYKNFHLKIGNRSLSEEEKELRKFLDCKLPTVIAGLMVAEFSKLQNVQTKIELVAQHEHHAHPRLKISFTHGDQTEYFSIDFRNQVGIDPSTGETYDLTHLDSIARAHDNSSSAVSVIEITPRLILHFDKRYTAKSVLFDSSYPNETQGPVQSLQALDTRFLNA